MRPRLGWVALLAAIVCLVGELWEWQRLVYFAKPLATLAILGIAWLAKRPLSARYRWLVVAGLTASLVGDVFLMLPGDRFVPGLASFLVAHLFYIAAFAGSGGGIRRPDAAFAVVTYAAVMLGILWPGLGAVRVPVVLYIAVIAAMGWQALARMRPHGPSGAAMAAGGAMLFLVSDSALALRRFVTDFPLSTVVVLVTYWGAQYLIARSVETAGGRRSEVRGQ